VPKGAGRVCSFRRARRSCSAPLAPRLPRATHVLLDPATRFPPASAHGAACRILAVQLRPDLPGGRQGPSRAGTFPEKKNVGPTGFSRAKEARRLPAAFPLGPISPNAHAPWNHGPLPYFRGRARRRGRAASNLRGCLDAWSVLEQTKRQCRASERRMLRGLAPRPENRAATPAVPGGEVPTFARPDGRGRGSLAPPRPTVLALGGRRGCAPPPPGSKTAGVPSARLPPSADVVRAHASASRSTGRRSAPQPGAQPLTGAPPTGARFREWYHVDPRLGRVCGRSNTAPSTSSTAGPSPGHGAPTRASCSEPRPGAPKGLRVRSPSNDLPRASTPTHPAGRSAAAFMGAIDRAGHGGLRGGAAHRGGLAASRPGAPRARGANLADWKSTPRRRCCSQTGFRRNLGRASRGRLTDDGTFRRTLTTLVVLRRAQPRRSLIDGRRLAGATPPSRSYRHLERRAAPVPTSFLLRFETTRARLVGGQGVGGDRRLGVAGRTFSSEWTRPPPRSDKLPSTWCARTPALGIRGIREN